MKKLNIWVYQAFFAFYSLFLFITNGFSQCGFVPVGTSELNQPSYTSAFYPSIAVDGAGTVYAAFSDGINSNKITVRKFDGTYWVNTGTPGFSAGAASYINIKTDISGIPYVAYQDAGNANKVTVMKFNGTAWVLVGTAGFSAGVSTFVSLGINASGTPYVSYQDAGNANKATVMKFNGTSWVNVGLAGFTTGAASLTSLALDPSGTPYVAFQDANNTTKGTVMKFNGTSWVVVGTAGFTSGSINGATAIAVDNTGIIYFASTQGLGIWVYKYNGATWSTSTTVGSSTARSPSFQIDGASTPYLFINNGGLGTVYKFNGTSWAIIGITGDFYTGSNYFSTSGTLDANGIPFLIGLYYASSNPNVIAYKYTGTINLTKIGVDGIPASSNSPLYTCMAVNKNGEPFIAFRDPGNSNKATVMKFDGTNWVTVGAAGFSAGAVTNISFAMDGGGTPYIAYQDAGNSGKATVMKFNGTAWVTVGSAGFSVSSVNSTSLIIVGSGTPYISYADGGNADKATVMKFNGTTWVTVGTPGFSAGIVSFTSLTIDPAGTPYISYRDAGNTNKATVMKFNGTNWITVGAAGFTTGAASYTSLAINAAGTPYISFSDAGNANKATTMKFNGTNWVTVGIAGFSTGVASYTSLVIDAAGTPYIAYTDNTTTLAIKKFDGTSWVTQTINSYSTQLPVSFPALFADGNGNIFVGYTRVIQNAGATLSKISVQKTNTTLPLSNYGQTLSVTPPFSTVFSNLCEAVAVLKPVGSSPINGNTTAKVWIEGTQPAQYAKRHYEITPAANASTATGKITLYYTQAEFDDFNAVSAVDLPNDPADAAGKANLLIEKRSGVSSDGTGLPSTYTGSVVTIDPADTDIIWNSTQNRWEISFDVTGFSGFFVKTLSGLLPLHLLNFSAGKQTGYNKLQWVTTNEVNTNHFIIERSADGSSFITIGTVAARSDGNNNYSYNDNTVNNSKVYYRLKMVDNNGSFTYSNIVFIKNDGKNAVTIYPNPAADIVNINLGSSTLTNSEARLFDANGRLLKSIQLKSTTQQIDISNLANGLYILKLEDGSLFKIIKQG